jgi:hypothetical protein
MQRGSGESTDTRALSGLKQGYNGDPACDNERADVQMRPHALQMVACALHNAGLNSLPHPFPHPLYARVLLRPRLTHPPFLRIRYVADETPALHNAGLSFPPSPSSSAFMPHPYPSMQLRPRLTHPHALLPDAVRVRW